MGLVGGSFRNYRPHGWDGRCTIHGLALCQYEGSDAVYRFSCNADWETEQDAAYASIAEAKAQLPNQYGGVPVTWKKA